MSEGEGVLGGSTVGLDARWMERDDDAIAGKSHLLICSQYLHRVKEEKIIGRSPPPVPPLCLKKVNGYCAWF